jgi:hypothetical protein
MKLDVLDSQKFLKIVTDNGRNMSINEPFKKKNIA